MRAARGPNRIAISAEVGLVRPAECSNEAEFVSTTVSTHSGPPGHTAFRTSTEAS